MASVFSNIFVASSLEEAVEQHLRLWFPTYIREVEKQQGLQIGVYEAPQSYTNRNEFEVIPGDVMPLAVVISPGIIGEPVTYEAGKYCATWSLGVGVAISGATEQLADQAVKVYGAAVRAIILQQTITNLPVIRVNWLDENYDDLPTLDNQVQYYKSAGVYFGIELEDVVNKFAGPSSPDDDPYSPVGVVETVDIVEEYLPPVS